MRTNKWLIWFPRQLHITQPYTYLSIRHTKINIKPSTQNQTPKVRAAQKWLHRIKTSQHHNWAKYFCCCLHRFPSMSITLPVSGDHANRPSSAWGKLIPGTSRSVKKATSGKFCPHPGQLQLTVHRRAGAAGRHVGSVHHSLAQQLRRTGGSDKMAHGGNLTLGDQPIDLNRSMKNSYLTWPQVISYRDMDWKFCVSLIWYFSSEVYSWFLKYYKTKNMIL